jgi:hypothetical protein
VTAGATGPRPKVCLLQLPRRPGIGHQATVASEGIRVVQRMFDMVDSTYRARRRHPTIGGDSNRAARQRDA